MSQGPIRERGPFEGTLAPAFIEQRSDAGEQTVSVRMSREVAEASVRALKGATGLAGCLATHLENGIKHLAGERLR